MKKIEAYIRHEAFEPIRGELLTLGFPSLTISEVKGSGRQKGVTERYRGAKLTNYLRPKVKLECVVATTDVETVVGTILKHARSGSIGDGKVFVMPVEEAYRIRTGESGEETLQPTRRRQSKSRDDGERRRPGGRPVGSVPARGAPADAGGGARRRRARRGGRARGRGGGRGGDRGAAARRRGQPRPARADLSALRRYVLERCRAAGRCRCPAGCRPRRRSSRAGR